MALRFEFHVTTDLEGPLPRCVELANTDTNTIMPDDVSDLAEAAITEVEAAQARVLEGHQVDLS
jgi:hypothetical protein